VVGFQAVDYRQRRILGDKDGIYGNHIVAALLWNATGKSRRRWFPLVVCASVTKHQSDGRQSPHAS
jgi:hypothetical protein